MRTAIAAALLLVPCIAASQDSVTIPKTVPYAEGVGSEDLRKECDWNTNLSMRIAAFAKPGVTISGSELGQGSGKVLSMIIVSVHSIGGGFSGPKWATIRGELRDGNDLVGSFHVNRTTMFGGLTACSALNSVGKAIGKDIAAWLSAPSMDAQLGNAK